MRCASRRSVKCLQAAGVPGRLGATGGLLAVAFLTTQLFRVDGKLLVGGSGYFVTQYKFIEPTWKPLKFIAGQGRVSEHGRVPLTPLFRVLTAFRTKARPGGGSRTAA